ncbi:MAG: AAA family ATPase [bacterium]|nr:AAA family ATPase [bacterium]
MAKKFNTTGTCIPQRHYTADISAKLDKIAKIVADGDYFTINRPRQYGKTTVLFLLEQLLRKDEQYLVIDISFEGIDTPSYESHERFTGVVLNIINKRLRFMGEGELADFTAANKDISDFERLSDFITEFVVKSGRKVVLMIDEVDKSSNSGLFLDFLGMLRTKYLKRNEGKDYSFHSVILAGVHDIKTIKARLREGQAKTFNSPWNIAVDFKVDLALLPGEIASMLQEYSEERNIKIDIPFFSETLYYFTSGYPFLVSSLCKLIDEEILPGKTDKEWKPEDLVDAVQLLLKADNTNFNSLIKNLEDNPELYDFVFEIIMTGRSFSFNINNPVIRFGKLYGIIREEKRKVKIHNRLYEQQIYDYMASMMETSGLGRSLYSSAGSTYVRENGDLNIDLVIRKFQEFMKEQYSSKDSDFIERNGRLLFLAFIKPVINGKGFDFKEVQISEEKRLDVVITFEKKKYIVELKIWRGESYHRQGIRQLCDYLDRQNQRVGYLLIYDLRKETGRIGERETIDAGGKKIHAAWV